MATANTNLSDFDRSKLPSTSEMKFGLVVSEWNPEITEALFQGAHDTLIATGTPSHQIIRQDVPGSFELVYGAKTLCEEEDFDAIIAIGSVIRGETAHFDYVCQGVTYGIQELNLSYETPVIFCVLTDDNMQQSKDRSGGKHGNKGIECAIVAIKMALLNL